MTQIPRYKVFFFAENQHKTWNQEEIIDDNEIG